MSRAIALASASTALAVLILGPAPAAADPDEGIAQAAPPASTWHLELAHTTRWLSSRSAGALAAGSRDGVGLTLSRRLLVIAPPRGPAITLSTEADADLGGLSGTTFQRLKTDLGSDDLAAGVRAEARLGYGVRVGARAAVGATRAALKVQDMYAASVVPIDDHGWGSLVTAAAVVGFDPAATAKARVGINLELGYVATSGVELHAYPGDRPAETQSLDTQYASVGHLDLDGWSLRIGLNALF